MTDLENWDDEEGLGLFTAVAMGAMIGFVSVTIVGAAIAWNAVSVAAGLARKVVAR